MMLDYLNVAFPYHQLLDSLDVASWGTPLVNDPAFAVAPQIVSHGDLDLAWIAYDTYFALIEPA
jgi:hypothetical protein